MIRRSTWIILAIFVIVTGAAALLQWYQNNHVEVEPTATPAPTDIPVFASGTAGINALRIENEAGETLAFSLNPEGWVVLEPEGSAITADDIEDAVLTINGWVVEDQLSSSPSSATIGLDTPAYNLQISKDDGTSYSVLVGDKTPTGSGYYVQVDAGNPVIVAVNSVDPVLNLFTIKPTPMPTTESSSTQTTDTVTATP